MHKLIYKHKTMDRPGVGTLSICFRRFRAKHVDATITIESFPDTTYYIPAITPKEIQTIADSWSEVDLAKAIVNIRLNRKDTECEFDAYQ